MASLVAILPFELIDHIVDILASYDYQQHRFEPRNIKTCALISRAFFQARTRRHMFRCVEIRDISLRREQPLSSAKLFTRLITKNPSIADYVRELRFVPQSFYFLPNPFTKEDLSAIIRLNKLEFLTIDAERGSSLKSWGGINPTTRSMLLRLIHLPSIQSLGLADIMEFPAVDIPKNSDKFKYLRLRRMTFDLDADTTFDEPSPPPASLGSSSTAITTSSASSFQTLQLHSLQIAGLEAFPSFHELLQTGPGVSSPFINLANLRHISISLDCDSEYPEIQEPIVQIFERTCSLETAHITCNASHSLLSSSVKLTLLFRVRPILLWIVEQISSWDIVLWVPRVTQHSLNTLKELSIEVEQGRPSNNPYEGLCHGLQDMHGKNHIEVLRIRVRLDNVHDQWKGQTGEVEWGLLEEIVLEPGWSSSLKEVHLHIITGEGQNARLGDVLNSLPLTHFPGLSSRRTVEFTFRVSPRMPPGSEPDFH